MTVYVVTGIAKTEYIGEETPEELYGVFSTRALAEECQDNLYKELDLNICYIEEVELDAFGYR